MIHNHEVRSSILRPATRKHSRPLCSFCIYGRQTAPKGLETLAAEYADAAAVLKNYEHLLDRLYSMNAKMLDLIGEYPRIKLRISKIQLEVLRWIEARSGHELGIAEDLENEIRKLSESIDLE